MRANGSDRQPSSKQNLTVRLDQVTIRRAKTLAASRGTSVSGLVARVIEDLLGEEDAYRASERQARMLLGKGYRLGGEIRSTRDELHER